MSHNKFVLKGNITPRRALNAYLYDENGNQVAKVHRAAGVTPGAVYAYDVTWFSQRAREEFIAWVPDTLFQSDVFETLELQMKRAA